MTDSMARINTACLLILAMGVFTTGLIYMRPVLEPFVFALFYYAVALPVVNLVQVKFRFPRILAVLSTTFLAFLATALIIYLVSQSIGDFVKEADAYREKLLIFSQQATEFLARNGIDLKQSDKVREEVMKLPIFGWLRGLTGGAFSFVGNFFLILIIFFFLIAGSGSVDQKPELQVEIESKISRYVISKTILSVATGIIVGIILAVFNIELAAMFAVLTILFNFIPNIGSILATLLPLPVIILQYGFGMTLVAVLVLSGATQLVIGNIVEPKVMGESMDLHPVTILIFLLFWGLVWGIAGMFLAVPITAIFKIILSRITFTKPLADLMAGRFTKA